MRFSFPPLPFLLVFLLTGDGGQRDHEHAEQCAGEKREHQPRPVNHPITSERMPPGRSHPDGGLKLIATLNFFNINIQLFQITVPTIVQSLAARRYSDEYCLQHPHTSRFHLCSIFRSSLESTV